MPEKFEGRGKGRPVEADFDIQAEPRDVDLQRFFEDDADLVAETSAETDDKLPDLKLETYGEADLEATASAARARAVKKMTGKHGRE